MSRGPLSLPQRLLDLEPQVSLPAAKGSVPELARRNAVGNTSVPQSKDSEHTVSPEQAQKPSQGHWEWPEVLWAIDPHRSGSASQRPQAQ